MGKVYMSSKVVRSEGLGLKREYNICVCVCVWGGEY